MQYRFVYRRAPADMPSTHGGYTAAVTDRTPDPIIRPYKGPCSTSSSKAGLYENGEMMSLIENRAEETPSCFNGYPVGEDFWQR
jgi:hypothetical protein